MLSIYVYSADGEFVYRCDVEDMPALLRVFRTELQPRYSGESFDVMIAGKLLITEPQRGPASIAPKLTKRQREVVQLLAQSYVPKQIAARLGIAESTVRMHITVLKKRFNVDNLNQLMAVAGALELCNPFQPADHAKPPAAASCTGRDEGDPGGDPGHPDGEAVDDAGGPFAALEGGDGPDDA